MGGPPMMGQPPAPASAPARAAQRFPRASAPSAGNGELLLRAHAGFGEFAVLDPGTGALRGVAGAVSAVAGLYADLSGMQVLFYRDPQAGLMLRVADQAVALDRVGCEAVWERGQGFHRLLVLAAGNPVCDLKYAPLPADADLGLLIRDVLADPARRAGIFG
ncbi:hypothetical protein ACWIGI_11390 [Nocardia sp. NPDC055321]